MADAAFSRHTMVHVAPTAWRAARPRAADPGADAVVEGWAEAGRPLVVRRQLCDDTCDAVPLGLPLPPSLGKERLALTIAHGAIVAASPPPLLRGCVERAPAAWRRTIADLLAVDPDVRCFGSLAWESMTGLAYLSPTSDLDLLWTVLDARATDRLVEAIAGIDRQAPLRIDGELLLPAGGGVQWREWQNDLPEVLVKSSTGAALVPRAELGA